MSKSYWMQMIIDTDLDKDACKSWFAGMADDLTPYRAEVLCERETDREKKIRAFMTAADGKHYQLERTRGGRTFSITMKPIAAPKVEMGAVARHRARSRSLST